MSSSKQIKLGALMSYAAIAINILTGLFYTPWMIRTIDRENFGLYTLAMSVITLFVFDFGLSSAITRFIAKYLAEGNQQKADNCLGLVYRLYITIDIVLFIILAGIFFYIPDIYIGLTPDEIEKFKVIYCMAALYSVVSFPFIPVNGVLNAHEQFVQVKICDVLHKLIIVGAMTVCLLAGMGLYALVMVNAVSGVLTIIFKLWCISHYTQQKISWHYFHKTEFMEIVKFSGWVTVTALAQRCIFNIAPSILGALSGSTAIAILGIATTLEGYTYTFANAINGMFLPKVSRIVANDKGNVLLLMIRVGRIQIYVVALIVFGIVCFGQEFIRLWVGDGFADSYLCAIMIVTPSFFHLPQMIGSETVYAANKVQKMAYVMTVMALVNLLGAFILAPSLGAKGICISVCIAYIVRTVGMDVIFYRDLHINVFRFFKESYINMLIPLLIVFAIGLVCSNYLPIFGWLGFVIKIGIFVALYSFVMFSFVMNSDEKDLILKPLYRFLRK